MTVDYEMTLDQKIKLKSLLIKHEGDRDFPYNDNDNPHNITIGIGRNLTGVGINQDEKDLMFKNDTDPLFDYLCKTYPWFNELNEDRQIALVDMAFMGKKNFSEFQQMIVALSRHDYLTAREEIINSEYGKKQPNRANYIGDVILKGVL